MPAKNEVKSNKINEEIRSELSLALNNWHVLDSKLNKTDKKEKSETTTETTKPQRKTKLLKTIQAQLKTLSF